MTRTSTARKGIYEYIQCEEVVFKINSFGAVKYVKWEKRSRLWKLGAEG